MTFQKTKLVVGLATATLTLAGALVAPEAMAHKKSSSCCKKAKSSKVQKRAFAVTGTSSEVAALQAQVNQLKDTVSALQAQVGSQSTNSSKVQELDAWMAQVKAEPKKVETKDNMVFFRGGFAHSNRTRNGVSITSNVASTGVAALDGTQADKNAWYMGAGFDFSLDDNLFGLSDNTEVMAELMFDYKEFNTVQGNVLASDNSVVVPGVVGGLTTPGGLGAAVAATNPRQVTVNQLTLAASPKIKFMKGSDFRPWIIPAGFALQVVSPPTESITVLQPAMMFGVGADYKLWKNIYVGADARYHYGLGGDMDGVNTNGFTAGGYLGLGF